MKLIPVIDLLNGQVVHAREGRRDQYLPIHTPLCASSHPADVVGALLALHPFPILYIADIDAILHRGENLATIRELRLQFPHLQFWVDQGLATCRALSEWQAADLGRAVIGSETLAAPDVLEAALHLSHLQPVLSLDFKSSGFAGPDWLLGQPALWPATVIVMSLPRVGSSHGPDLQQLQSILQMAGNRQVIAAGGVRHPDDLHQLAQCRAAGVLLASALHSGQVNADVLAHYAHSD